MASAPSDLSPAEKTLVGSSEGGVDSQFTSLVLNEG